MTLPSPSRGTRVIGSPIGRTGQSAWVKHGFAPDIRSAWEPLGVHPSTIRGWTDLGFTAQTIPADWARHSRPEAWVFTEEARLPRDVAWGALWAVASTRYAQWAHALGQDPHDARRLANHTRSTTGVVGLPDGGPVWVGSPADARMTRMARQVRALHWGEVMDALGAGVPWSRLRWRNRRARAAKGPLPRPMSPDAVTPDAARAALLDGAVTLPLSVEEGGGVPAIVVTPEFAAVGAALGRTPAEIGRLALALHRRYPDRGKTPAFVNVGKVFSWPVWSSGHSYTFTTFAASCANVSWADVATCLEAGMPREEALAHTLAGADMDSVRLLGALT